ncbi:Gfo/Idh/MocA family protein [Hamadaea tsunoensis]|uniref:Gfo/Idh/MocA family protein n=1 Tax=Hamadaea tsunoensis TaxID=53368 RepID=UPI000489C26F|nr:Gfo/Idh/MocA family oxidoreductase [Hamadaea tsunoensis]
MRFGLVGTGYWAENVHGRALAAHPEADLVGVWGRDPAKAAGVADKLGAKAYAEMEALLADVDAVAIALPPAVQAPLAAQAARAGRHLLLDKPLALTVAAAEDVAAAAGETNIASVVFFTGRFDPAITASLDEAAATGGWIGARAAMIGSIHRPGSPYAQSQWRHEFGGLWDVGPHALSRVLPVLGPATSVTAFLGAAATAHVLVAHEGGAVSELMLSIDAPADLGFSGSSFFGGTGVLDVADPSVTAVEAYANAVDQLIAASGEGVPRHPCDVAFGVEVVRVLAAAEESIASGRAVSL